MICTELLSWNQLVRRDFCKDESFADVKRYYFVDFTGPMLIYRMWQASLRVFHGLVKLMMQDSGCSSVHSCNTQE